MGRLRQDPELWVGYGQEYGSASFQIFVLTAGGMS